MINVKALPRILLHLAGEFTDETVDLASFGRDAVAFSLAPTDHFYFGLSKPFSQFFLELAVPNDRHAAFAGEYWNGSAWVALDNLIDETRGLQRSGFFHFDKPTDWEKNSVDGKENFWVRFAPDEQLLQPIEAVEADPEADPPVEAVEAVPGCEMQGMGCVFSDDGDLVGVYPGIMNFKEDTEASFILRHETARDDIVQFIRNSGITKISKQLGQHAQVQMWDLLDFAEVKAWSKYLALANIFSGLQSKEDSVWKQKAEEYVGKAEDARAAFYLSLDANDDGQADPSEMAMNITTRRLSR